MTDKTEIERRSRVIPATIVLRRAEAPQSHKSKTPRWPWGLLLLLAVALGAGALLKSRKNRDSENPTADPDGPTVDLTDAPVVVAPGSDDPADGALPVAGTASADGGLGAASTQG